MSGDSFGDVVAAARADGRLVVQPRMGFGDPRQMRDGLLQVSRAAATTVGTITVDSYTRLGQHEAAQLALSAGTPLNGYPIVAHEPGTTRAMLAGVAGGSFPVQVRHGSAVPQQIIAALGRAGLSATEGGPLSYCLPYGRTPVTTSVANWEQACEELAELERPGRVPHLETFGGCMLGQLCPPSLLVAISVLEGLFFRQHHLRSISLSYAQQTDVRQDEEAIGALGRLSAEFLGDLDWHIVVYAYMGRFPRTAAGAGRLMADAARLAVRTGAARIIVKTAAEAHRIPTVAENVTALEDAARAAAGATRQPAPVSDTETYLEARALLLGVLELHDDVGRALVLAMQRGLLDVPYCLHPDNAGETESHLDDDGWLRWSRTGAMPIRATTSSTRHTSADLLASLSYVERSYDSARPVDADVPSYPTRRTR